MLRTYAVARLVGATPLQYERPPLIASGLCLDGGAALPLDRVWIRLDGLLIGSLSTSGSRVNAGMNVNGCFSRVRFGSRGGGL